MTTESSRLSRRLSTLDAALRSMGKRLIESHSSLESGLRYLRDRYARTYIWLTATANRRRYAAPADPYRFVEVDPHSIERVAELPGPLYLNAGAVVGGAWDRTTTRFVDLDVYRAYERHFEDGVPWHETDFFERIVGELAAGRERWGCRTRAEFEARCGRIDDLYDRIEESGYRTQDELHEHASEDPIKPPNRLPTERLTDEIAVHIGRDGRLLFEDGRNRLSIVKLLDLDRIPVRVLRRHEAWQDVRDAYVAGDSAARDYAAHPDLASLSFGSRP